MSNFKITKTILENINEQNDRINECIDIVNGYTTDEETRVNQELQRQQNELKRQEQYNNIENRFNNIDTQLETITTNDLSEKTLGKQGIKTLKADGITPNDIALESLISYCISNKLKLVLPQGTIVLTKTLNIPDGLLEMTGQSSSRLVKSTILKFTQTDGTDCIKISNANQNNIGTSLSNIQIEGNVNSGRGLVIDGTGSANHKFNNIYIKNCGKETLYINNFYIGSFSDCIFERWDGKVNSKIINSALVGFNNCCFNNSVNVELDGNVVIDTCNSLKFNNCNVNGGKGVKLINSFKCIFDGYHEIGYGTLNSGYECYAFYLDEYSRGNNIDIQTVELVIDNGYNNKWSTSILKEVNIDNKKLANNIFNPLTGTLADVDKGGTLGVANINVVNEKGLFNPKSIKLTSLANTSTKTFILTPGNSYGNYGYNIWLKPNVTYFLGLSLKTDINSYNGNYGDVYPTITLKYLGHLQGISPVCMLPITSKQKQYMFSFRTPSNIPEFKSGFMIEIKNTSPTDFNFLISDIFFTDSLEECVTSVFSTTDLTIGNYLKGTEIMSYSDNKKYIVSKNGTVRTSITVNATITANNTTISITNGGELLKNGDYVTITNGTNTYERKIVNNDISSCVIDTYIPIGGDFTITLTTPTFI